MKVKIYPVVGEEGIAYKVSVKTLFSSKNLAEVYGSAFGSVYRDKKFKSVKEARDYIRKTYGDSCQILEWSAL